MWEEITRTFIIGLFAKIMTHQRSEKRVHVEDYPIAVSRSNLKDVDFPAYKQKIIQQVQERSGNNTDSQNVLPVLLLS